MALDGEPIQALPLQTEASSEWDTELEKELSDRYLSQYGDANPSEAAISAAPMECEAPIYSNIAFHLRQRFFKWLIDFFEACFADFADRQLGETFIQDAITQEGLEDATQIDLTMWRDLIRHELGSPKPIPFATINIKFQPLFEGDT